MRRSICSAIAAFTCVSPRDVAYRCDAAKTRNQAGSRPRSARPKSGCSVDAERGQRLAPALAAVEHAERALDRQAGLAQRLDRLERRAARR